MARRERDYCAIAMNYCRDVVSGRQLSCELVRMSCQRQIDDLQKFEQKKRYPYSWQPDLANRVCRFIERMPHVKGEWAKHGKTITLEPWQCFLLTTPFGWVRKSDGMRRFRRGYIRIARKNGKTIISAGIGLYMLTADEESGAEVYAAATTWAQSAIAWQMAKMMVNKLPAFRKRYGLIAGSRAIASTRLGTTFQPLTGNPGDGSNPHCAIVDEYHEHKTALSYDALATGMGARAQPLLWTITTAGYDRASPCYDLDLYARQVLPYDLEVIRACPRCIFHIHNNGYHIAPHLVQIPELDVIEVVVDPYPDAERKQYEIEMLQMIQRHKPLIVDVNFPSFQEAEQLLAQLSPRGLCYNARFDPETFASSAPHIPGKMAWLLS